MQVSNETTVHVRRPGNPKKWRAKVLCEGKIADLALVTVEDDHFWTDELLDLQFVDVPELQASLCVPVIAWCLFHTYDFATIIYKPDQVISSWTTVLPKPLHSRTSHQPLI